MTSWKNDDALLRALVLGLAVTTFLVAAKAHGRQLRLERELAGFFNVTFRARNPDWVEAFWSRERLFFWILAAVLFAITIGIRTLASRFDVPFAEVWLAASPSWAGALVLHVILPLVGAFMGTGLVSFARAALSSRAFEANQVNTVLWGSLFWWGLTLATSSALLKLAWRRAEG